MKKWVLLLFSLLLIFSSQAAFATPEKTKDVKAEIEKIRQEEVAYHLKEIGKMNRSDKQKYVKGLNLALTNVDDEKLLRTALENALKNAYIYFMDIDGTVYDRDAQVVGVLPTTMETTEQSDISITATPVINGSSTGAFIRQTSMKGYIGSRTEFVLPSNKTNPKTFDIPLTNATGYIYNGLDLYQDTGQTGAFAIEGGLQVSQENNNFSAYIRVNGSKTLIYKDDSTPSGSYPPRYKAGTSFISNLRYESANGKVKYYASGTNVNGESQLLVFSYTKSFTTTQKNDMRAKRVLGIAKDAFKETDNVGMISLKYTSATLMKTDGTTVNYNTNLLDQVLYNNKIYGTAYWPSSKCTYSPTSGDISTQSQKIDTTK